MDITVGDFIYQNGKRIEEYENTPREFVDPYSDMTTEEKSKLILILQDMLRQREDEAKKKDEKNNQLNNKLDEMLRRQAESNSQIAKLTELLSEMQRSNLEKEKRIEDLLKEIADLKADKKKARKDRFGSSSQKSKQDGSDPAKNRKQDKDDFDGTPG